MQHACAILSSVACSFYNVFPHYFINGILVFMQSTNYSCHILMNLQFSRKSFEKYSNTKFHENSFSGSRVVPCGRTDRQTDTTKLIVAFRNFANAPKYGYFQGAVFLFTKL